MKTTSYRYKEGVEIRTSHDLPHIARIRTVAVETAPDTDDGIVWITEAYRPPRHTDDAHTWCNAFDFRVRNIFAPDREAMMGLANGWVLTMRGAHGDRRYQFALHGKGSNIHIHAEFDPR